MTLRAPSTLELDVPARTLSSCGADDFANTQTSLTQKCQEAATQKKPA
ncbi:hypothetical protein L6R29_00340 [Myxococcota bacterium]|nr:hypothetical protein [Myxococcota bacterium]